MPDSTPIGGGPIGQPAPPPPAPPSDSPSSAPIRCLGVGVRFCDTPADALYCPACRAKLEALYQMATRAA